MLKAIVWCPDAVNFSVRFTISVLGFWRDGKSMANSTCLLPPVPVIVVILSIPNSSEQNRSGSSNVADAATNCILSCGLLPPPPPAILASLFMT